jgi:muramoyltetrapeptide carboxypeptidase
MNFRLAPRIRKGDAIQIIAPGSPVRDRKALQEGIQLLEGLGYQVGESERLYDRHALYAGDDEIRAREVNRSFADPSVSAIFCARGGTGSSRILPLLDYDMIGRNPKLFLGYSDTTAVQIALLKLSGLVSFYGPMVETDLGKRSSAERRGQLLSLLAGEDARLELRGSEPGDVLTLYPGETSGRLVGGCLSIFASLLGTPYEPDTTDTILFFEDVDEYPHRIDRYLTQLLLAGKLQSARGIIFGSFPGSTYPPDHDYHDYRVSMIDIIKDSVAPLKIPCIYGLPFGHVSDPYTIPLGGYARLDATRRRLLLERGVA